MIDYGKVRVGDKFKIVGAGAPGFAQLGDIVTATKTAERRVDVVHDKTGTAAYFALSCGAARLEPYDPLASLRPDETTVLGEAAPV
jgi:hypothetical protein